MKKHALLLALTAATTAHAESTVTLYGIVDAAIVGDHGGRRQPHWAAAR